MSDFQTCYLWTMLSEDPRLQYSQVADDCPRGCAGPCFAISGINSGAFPHEFEAIQAIPRSQRGPAVESFYQANFWNHWYDLLRDDDVAKRVFDQAVNGGAGTAVKILQVAINLAAGTTLVAEDGGWGPMTLAAANAQDTATLVEAVIKARCDHYRAIAAANPADEKFLAQWIARAEK